MNFVEIENEKLVLSNEEFLKYISELEVDINLILIEDEYLIFWLIGMGKLNLIKILKKLNFKVPSRTELITIFPLHHACEMNKLDIVKFLLDEGMDPNMKSEYNLLPLHHCGEHESMEIISLLLERGADINAKSETRWTILRLACCHGNINMVKFLLEKGAKIEYENDEPTCLESNTISGLSDKIKKELSDIILNYRMGKIKGIVRVE